MTRTLRFAVPAVGLALMFTAGSFNDRAPNEGSARRAEFPVSQAGGPPPVEGDTITTDSGLKYIVIIRGDGRRAERHRTVRVQYSGWLEDGTLFDSSVLAGEPTEFELGAGQVIRGWDEGVNLMRAGDMWRLIIPPELGYGDRGYPDVIPSNATLIFDIALLAVK
ncbi:MAG: FKBP-type peptidyl-prolyl cis-trans isomerase [Gemmatimonadetes bacterium]|nr:FKBP-type peptidyl-prolyl cis-trans isomerase [Gemmatimonadota bacterium]NIO32452.1 FKBP-type peptidyl-prolyl cis-trans isomerase [Gemmatimonadota bacterium]